MSRAPEDPSAATAAVAAASASSDAVDCDDQFAGLDLVSDDDEDRPAPRRLLRAECILSHRTSRFLLVVETLQDANNAQAILRTADSFGIQNVWVVESGKPMKHEDKLQSPAMGNVTHESAAAESAATGTISMASGRWLSLRYFKNSADCIAALKADRRSIWVTTLSSHSVRFDRAHCPPLPPRVALVLGRELDGVSPEFCAAADQSVFLPMVGFSESFNVSVAAALLCQRLFDLAPEADGDMSEDERGAVRREWYRQLSRATPGSEPDYLNHWLPRAERTVAEMRAAVASEGEGGVLRPPDESRLPKINAKVRRRMAAEGQRSVATVADKKAEAAAAAILAGKPAAVAAAPPG